ncbi:MAG: hypothetical protein SFV21_14505 [Rhodospirillaceae bacterium]|nr:hypothetical protein [Rhodospirillaceae bacterium]
MISEAFKALLARVAAGEDVPQIDLLPFLQGRALADRQIGGLALAQAYAKAGKFPLATVLARRAFDVGGWHFDTYAFCYTLLMAQDRLDEAVAITREAMLMAADRGHVALVYSIFGMFSDIVGRWPAVAQSRPDPHADRIIGWLMERSFTPGNPPALRPDVLDGRKIRIGVMLAGDQAEESALTRVALSFARHHDRAKFDVHVYSYLTLEENARTNPRYGSWVDDITAWGCTFHEGVRATGLARVMATHKSMLMDQLDVVIFNMLIRDYYVLALMRPAPVVIGAVHGNPRGYSLRSLDACITGDPHSLIESLSDAYLVRPSIDFDLLAPSGATGDGPLARADIGADPAAVLIMSGAQAYKFNSPQFWSMVDRVLHARPLAQWAVCGVTPADVRGFGVKLQPEIADRVKLVPWRTDYVTRVLPLADVVVDTFPAGGALALFWAMRLGKPCLSFRSNYFRTYSQLDWSPAFRALAREDLALPPGDLDGLAGRILNLVDDADARGRLGAECRDAVAALDDHRRYAADMEAAVVDAIRRKRDAGLAKSPQA